MQITAETLPLIENALGVQLYEPQKEYLVNNGPYWFGGRGTGKTLAFCIKLALSDGEPLNMGRPVEIIDPGSGPPGNELRYAIWFRRFFLDIWEQLKNAGFPVRGTRR